MNVPIKTSDYRVIAQSRAQDLEATIEGGGGMFCTIQCFETERVPACINTTNAPNLFITVYNFSFDKEKAPEGT